MHIFYSPCFFGSTLNYFCVFIENTSPPKAQANQKRPRHRHERELRNRWPRLVRSERLPGGRDLQVTARSPRPRLAQEPSVGGALPRSRLW